jgi:hypothetical protein
MSWKVEVHDQRPNLDTYIITSCLVDISADFVKEKPSEGPHDINMDGGTTLNLLLPIIKVLTSGCHDLHIIKKKCYLDVPFIFTYFRPTYLTPFFYLFTWI